ncbi:MAG: aminoacetone oxidase family FAD-binding enzyme [Mailhella sp.]|nr:aminoacetone oxidase family FAD-binding enzyme [Mailhella sp.]
MLYDVAVIGAGPAGLLCARDAARRGLRVALIDSHEEPGVKLAIAGGGKGNITNRILAENRYVGSDTGILRSALKVFSCDDALALMRELALPWEERDFGQIFGLKPASFMADRLAVQCDDAGVDFYLGRTAKNITRPDAEGEISGPAFGRSGAQTYFSLFAGQEKITARQLVIAAGSPACPQLGANDQLARLAASWGHDIVPFQPVLVPLVMPENWALSGLEGISLNVRLGLKAGNDIRWPDPEGIRSLLFTHRGVSGPAVLVVSCWWKPGEELVIDFLPELPILELLNEKENGKLIVRNLLARRLPARLADALCPEDLARRKVAELGKKDRLRLADIVHRFCVLPAGTEGLRRAEAAAGGVSLASLSRKLESLHVPGLFFCGEIVDIAGLLGGYNIHWAFASGAMVAKGLKKGE